MMNAAAAAAVALALLLAVAVQHAEGSGGDVDLLRRYRRRRGRDHGFHRPPTPPTPTPTPTPTPPPPSPSPLCNRTVGPDGILLQAASDECPSPAPPPPQQQHGGRMPPCFCPRPPFRRPSPPPPAASNGLECVTALAGLMPCGAFVTGSQDATPAPQSDCCTGMGNFFNASTASNDRTLRCLCPVIVGDVNKVLPKPIDPVRLMYLPIACGIVLPPQTLFMCFTGHPNPTVVDRFSELWESTSSSPAPPAPADGQQPPPPLVGRIPDASEKPSPAASTP